MAFAVKDEQYRSIAELRHQIRLFLHRVEMAAQSHGIGGQQYQLLLAIRGMPGEMPCTIRALSERLRLKHHSTVELADRLEANRLVMRSRDRKDRRRVFVKLTPKGRRILEAIIRDRLADIHSAGREFAETVHALLKKGAGNADDKSAKRLGAASRRSSRAKRNTHWIAAD